MEIEFKSDKTTINAPYRPLIDYVGSNTTKSQAKALSRGESFAVVFIVGFCLFSLILWSIK